VVVRVEFRRALALRSEIRRDRAEPSAPHEGIQGHRTAPLDAPV